MGFSPRDFVNRNKSNITSTVKKVGYFTPLAPTVAALDYFGAGNIINPNAKSVTTEQSSNNNGGSGAQAVSNNGGSDNSPVSSYEGWSSGGGGGSTVDWADIAASQDALNQANFQLGQIPGQRDIGLQNISDVFTNYRNSLNGQKGINERNYSTNRTQTIQDNERARASIDATTRQRAGALQRYMGAMGGGDSEAARIIQHLLQKSKLNSFYFRFLVKPWTQFDKTKYKLYNICL